MQRGAGLLITAMTTTLVVTRAYLHWRPDTDLNIGRYNVHHLFTGVLIMAICGIPAILGGSGRRAQAILTMGFGVGLSLALDQWVYLIATDGTNASYLLPISWIPASIMVALACAYTALLGRRRPDG